VCSCTYTYDSQKSIVLLLLLLCVRVFIIITSCYKCINTQKSLSEKIRIKKNLIVSCCLELKSWIKKLFVKFLDADDAAGAAVQV